MCARGAGLYPVVSIWSGSVHKDRGVSKKIGKGNQIKGSKRVCSWLVLVKNEDRLRHEHARSLCKENDLGKGRKKEEILVMRREKVKGGKKK